MSSEAKAIPVHAKSTTQDPQTLKSWEEKAAWAQNKRDASLAKVEPKLQGIPDDLPLNSRGLPKSVLTQQELDITENYSVTQLLTILRERKVSVEEVTKAFLRRAALAHAAVCPLILYLERNLMSLDKLCC